MKVTIVGPNLRRPFSDKGALHVHKAGCRDLAKVTRAAGDDGWTIEVATVKEAILDIYPPDNFDYDENDPDEYVGYRSDVYVAPCVTLPEGN